jgi:hypothetical protein
VANALDGRAPNVALRSPTSYMDSMWSGVQERPGDDAVAHSQRGKRAEQACRTMP